MKNIKTILFCCLFASFVSNNICAEGTSYSSVDADQSKLTLNLKFAANPFARTNLIVTRA